MRPAPPHTINYTYTNTTAYLPPTYPGSPTINTAFLPPPPLNTDVRSPPSSLPPAAPILSPPSSLPHPPPIASGYSHPPASHQPPFSYPHAPLRQYSMSNNAPTSPSGTSQMNMQSPPAAQSPTTTAGSQSFSPSRPPSLTSNFLMRPPPLSSPSPPSTHQLSYPPLPPNRATSSNPSPGLRTASPPSPNYFITDEGTQINNAYNYPSLQTTSNQQYNNPYAASVQPTANGSPSPSSYPNTQSMNPPMPQPTQHTYEPYPQLPLLHTYPTSGPPPPAGSGYFTSTPSPTSPPLLPPPVSAQPIRFSWVKPVDSSHIQLACQYFPDNIELFNECHIPFGVLIRPLSPGLSAHPCNDPSISVAPSILPSPAGSALPSPRQLSASASAPFSYPPPSPTNGNPFFGPTPSSPGPAIPIIRPGAAGVIRCKECKAYINGYVHWLDAGRQWRCNICLVDNPTPAPYFAQLTSEGKRVDWEEREELKNASYEIYAPKDYMVRAPVPPLFCLCIEVSASALQRGMVRDVCNAVLPLIDRMAQHPKALISIVTFSEHVHYYTITTKQKSPQMHVLTTLDNLFLPAPFGMLIRVCECKDQIISLLHSLPICHIKEPVQQSCLGSALECCMLIMGRYGGRLMVFLSSLTSVGKGILTDREKELLLKEKTEKSGSGIEGALLKPAGDFYKKTGDSLQKHQITCDLFFFPPSGSPNSLSPAQYTDVTTFTELARYTGGQVYYYHNYSSELCSASLINTVQSLILRNQCFEAVFRVRASRGVLINDFHGHFSIRGNDLLSIPCVDAEKAISFELKIDDKEKDYLLGNKERSIIVQTGLLYTSYACERKILVHTLCVPITNQLARLMESVNMNASLGILSKHAVWLVYAHSLFHAREYVKQTCATMVRCIRKTPVKSETAANIISTFPFYCLSLIKSSAFVDGSSGLFISSDQRSSLLSYVYTSSMQDLLQYVQPILLPLHLLITNPEMGTQKMTDGSNDHGSTIGSVLMPDSVPLSHQSLSSDGVWLLYSGIDLLIWIGSTVPPHILFQLLGVQTMDNYNTENMTLLSAHEHTDNTSLLRRVWNVVDFIRASSSYQSRVQLIREGEQRELLLFAYLYEDRKGKEGTRQEFQQLILR